jgi:hypothetical protein
VTVWVSWTLQDREPPEPSDGGTALLRSGETLAEASQALSGLPVSAFLANCSCPESITLAMPELVALGDVPAGGYANAFTGIPKDWVFSDGVGELGTRRDLDPAAYPEHIEQRHGFQLVGSHQARVAHHIRSHNRCQSLPDACVAQGLLLKCT